MQTEQPIINRARNCGDSLQLLEARSGGMLQKISITKDSQAPNDAISEPKSRQDLVLLFLTELLKSRIAAQRVPDRIEPKKGRRNAQLAVPHAIIGRL